MPKVLPLVGIIAAAWIAGGTLTLGAPLPNLGPILTWLNDYDEGAELAKRGRRMLFVYFQDEQPGPLAERFENESLSDTRVRQALRDYVLVRVPRDVPIGDEPDSSRLIDHPAFAPLEGRSGVAIIDLLHAERPEFRHVVSVLSFAPGKYYRYQPDHLSVLLELPPGTLTQRTMMFAVRIHPEGPLSTMGEVDTELLKAAEEHSSHQAQIQRQGHHQWDRRFHRLAALLPGGLRPQEVVAESWPHESLLDAAVDCVHSWRQSSGHWGAVRSHQPRFAYDMRRGRNGIWYATGLFGNRH